MADLPSWPIRYTLTLVHKETYKHALEPRVEFRVVRRNEIPSSFRLPMMDFWAPEWHFAFDELWNRTDYTVAPNEDADKDDFNAGELAPNSFCWNSVFDWRKDLVPVMSFRLSMSAPLL